MLRASGCVKRQNDDSTGEIIRTDRSLKSEYRTRMQTSGEALRLLASTVSKRMRRVTHSMCKQGDFDEVERQ